jgi:hypothetical protein
MGKLALIETWQRPQAICVTAIAVPQYGHSLLRGTSIGPDAGIFMLLANLMIYISKNQLKTTKNINFIYISPRSLSDGEDAEPLCIPAPGESEEPSRTVGVLRRAGRLTNGAPGGPKVSSRQSDCGLGSADSAENQACGQPFPTPLRKCVKNRNCGLTRFAKIHIVPPAIQRIKSLSQTT